MVLIVNNFALAVFSQDRFRALLPKAAVLLALFRKAFPDSKRICTYRS